MNNKEMQKMIEDYAFKYAQALLLYGVDISGKYDTAVSLTSALENAYVRGKVDGIKYMDDVRLARSESTCCDRDCKNCYKTKLVTPQWIPCSERLPEKAEGNRFSANVLITYHHCYTGEPLCNSIACYDYKDNCWLWCGYGRSAEAKVVAWMPLPEAYGGGHIWKD